MAQGADQVIRIGEKFTHTVPDAGGSPPPAYVLIAPATNVTTPWTISGRILTYTAESGDPSSGQVRVNVEQNGVLIDTYFFDYIVTPPLARPRYATSGLADRRDVYYNEQIDPYTYPVADTTGFPLPTYAVVAGDIANLPNITYTNTDNTTPGTLTGYFEDTFDVSGVHTPRQGIGAIRERASNSQGSDNKFYAFTRKLRPPRWSADSLPLEVRGRGETLPVIIPEVDEGSYATRYSLVSPPSGITINSATRAIDTRNAASGVHNLTVQATNQYVIPPDFTTIHSQSDTITIQIVIPGISNRVTARDFDTLAAAGNTSPEGIWVNGSTDIYVTDSVKSKVFVYDYTSKARKESAEIDMLNDLVLSPRGIAGSTTTDRLYIVDDLSKMISVFKLSDMTYLPDENIYLLGFTPGTDSEPRGLWLDTSTGTLYVVYERANRILAYNVTSRERDSAKDISPGISGIHEYYGVWSNGMFLWLSDSVTEKIYGFNLSTRTRDARLDIVPVSGGSAYDFTALRGIYGDSTNIYAVDGDKLTAVSITTAP